MTVRDDLIVVLAAARLTRLVTEDEITRPLRERVEGLHDEAEYLVNCRYCVGIWAAAAVMLMQKHPVGRTVNQILAVAGVGNAVHRVWDL